jgi:hypothetical protein
VTFLLRYNTAPFPVFRPADEFGAQRVCLNVSQKRQQVPILLDRKVRQQVNGDSFPHFRQEFEECQVIAVLEEKLPAAIAAIEHMVDHAAGGNTSNLWHGLECRLGEGLCQDI